MRKLRTFLRYSPWTEAMGSTQKHFKIIEINSLSLRALDVTKMHRNGERCCATVLTKITWARFTNASKHSEINSGVLQNRDVSKTYGDGEQFGAVVLTKIPRARFRNALKSLKSVARHHYSRKVGYKCDVNFLVVGPTQWGLSHKCISTSMKCLVCVQMRAGIFYNFKRTQLSCAC